MWARDYNIKSIKRSSKNEQTFLDKDEKPLLFTIAELRCTYIHNIQ